MGVEIVPAEHQVLVIDHHEGARNLVVNGLLSAGFVDVVTANDGDSAWQRLCSGQHFSLIVLEWKLEGSPRGLALFSRIRSLPAFQMTPILVVSGFVQRHDFRLLGEFPCTGLIEKPFTNQKFQASVEGILQEALWYDQNEALIASLLTAVNHDGKTAVQLIKQVLKKSPKPLPLAMVATKCLVKNKLLGEAKTILEGVLKADDQALMALNEMGKILHLMGKHEEALFYLRQASDLSPDSMERLCLIGEAKLNIKDPEGARKSFQKALKLDADNLKASQGLIVAENMIDLFASSSPLRVTGTFASMMNTMGIAYVRNGNFAQGIAQYQAALSFLSTGADRSRVAFNLGLAFLRWGKSAAALTWFQRSEAEHQSTGNRSASYVRKLLLKGTSGIGEQIATKTPDSAAAALPANVLPLVKLAEEAKALGEVQEDDESEVKVQL